MGTPEQNTPKGESAGGRSSPSERSHGAEFVDLEDEDPAIEDEESPDLIEEGEDEFPGDRRRDPLRRP